MPSFIKPFASVAGRNSYSLFDIRLDQDHIFFLGNGQQPTVPLVKGVIMLCLPSALRISNLRLRLTGTSQLSWSYQKQNTPGVQSKVKKSTTVLEHQWAPLVGTENGDVTIPAGNHEYPFEIALPEGILETIEGVPEVSITYRLKATIERGKFACDLHTHKDLRIIRTLESGEPAFLRSVGVEDIWVNKADYSVTIPQKAALFGSTIRLQVRLTPLLKGLEMESITASLMETRHAWVEGPKDLVEKEKKVERQPAHWVFDVDRERHWHDIIEETGQEGWALTVPLDLPKQLGQCVQDVNHNGIKIQHKVRVIIGLRNPDGHVSAVKATLPIWILLPLGARFDEKGTLLNASAIAASMQQDLDEIPPGYGEHLHEGHALDVAEFEGLSRVPSYCTTVGTSTWSQSDGSDSVPDYETAVSTPLSEFPSPDFSLENGSRQRVDGWPWC